MQIAYCRVSTDDQLLNLQKDALIKIGCDKIFEDVMSGAKDIRPGLTDALEYLREGDTLVVWRLDRLGRSLKHLINTVESLEQRKIGFKSLQESIDTSTSSGRLVFHLFCALAEFERNLIRDRTQAGLQAARARGKSGGRPKALSAKQIEIGKTLAADRNRPVKEICEHMNISRATFYRHISPKAVIEHENT